MCPGHLKTEMIEQTAVRQADASGDDTRQNQHEEDRMRDIHVGKRGSEAAGEETSLDKLRKTVRFQQEAPSAAASSDPTLLLWNMLRVVRRRTCAEVGSCW